MITVLVFFSDCARGSQSSKYVVMWIPCCRNGAFVASVHSRNTFGGQGQTKKETLGKQTPQKVKIGYFLYGV